VPAVRASLARVGRRLTATARELQRRRVWNVAVLYSAAAFVLWQAADIAAPALGVSDRVMTVTVWGTVVAFPLVLVLAWLFDLTPRGIERTAPAAPGPDSASSGDANGTGSPGLRRPV
jgi:hypothetical protein